MRTFVVALTAATTVTAATAELAAAAAAIAAVDAAGFSAGGVTDVLDIDQPVPISAIYLTEHQRCGADNGAAGKPLVSGLEPR
jgi:hypothetical protein